MAKTKLADAVRWLNDQYGADLTYQHAYMAAIAGRVPAERDATGRFWLVDESNLTAMAQARRQTGCQAQTGCLPFAHHPLRRLIPQTRVTPPAGQVGGVGTSVL
jgi:hypothetical protein